MVAKIKYKITVVNDVQGKICSKCKIWKVLTEFGKNKRLPTGTKLRCKTCCDDEKPQCIYPGCSTKAVHSYEHCTRHGGGPKCEYVDKVGNQCKTARISPHKFCARHGGK